MILKNYLWRFFFGRHRYWFFGNFRNSYLAMTCPCFLKIICFTRLAPKKKKRREKDEITFPLHNELWLFQSPNRLSASRSFPHVIVWDSPVEVIIIQTLDLQSTWSHEPPSSWWKLWTNRYGHKGEAWQLRKSPVRVGGERRTKRGKSSEESRDGGRVCV